LRKALALFTLLLLTAGFIGAQEYGAIRGKVTDNEGNALPGVSVTLTGSKTAPRSIVTSAEGNFRFLNLPVANDYQIVLELTGFKTHTRSNLAVSYGRDVTLEIQLEQAALEEQVTVVGQTPVIDTKRTQVGVNITSEMIMRLPTARDPWVLMQLSPGMLIDRENVGGSDSGQQSSYFGHGSAGGDSTWSVDGANITDNSALGSAPAYLNMAGFEEILINYGNNDVKSQTGGVQLNFISKRGGNAFSGMAYVDASKAQWQAHNLPTGLPASYTGAGIKKVYLYGANFGGPIVKDRLWFYGSYGIQDLGTVGITGVDDNTWLESGYFRLDGQIAKNTRANLFYEYDNKQKWGRTTWGPAQEAPEVGYNQVGPTPIYKVELEQMAGNLFLNAKWSYTHNVFHLIPKLGERDAQGPNAPYVYYNYYPDFYASGNSPGDYNTVRPQTNINFNGNYFAENVLGADHEFKFGVDYTKSDVSSYSLFTGNVQIHNYAYLDYVEAWVIRDWYVNTDFRRYSAFAQDTMSFGRLAMTLGLRYDMEKSTVTSTQQPAVPYPELAYYLCDLSVDKFDPKMRSKILSPRLSLVYDISGDGKNVLKLNLARYGTQMGYDFANFLNPVPWAEIDLPWEDGMYGGLADGRIQEIELGYGDPGNPDNWSWFGGFNPSDPSTAESTNKYDPNYKTPLLDELSVSFEREILTDFAVRLEGFYKNRHRYSIDRGIMSDGTLETRSNLITLVDDVTEAAYVERVDWPYGSYRTNYLDGTLQADGSVNGTIKDKEHETYLAGEIVLKKRLSHNWMLDGSFTLSSWKYYHGNTKEQWWDIANFDFYEGGVNAPQSGGSGISNVWVNARWMAKLAGLYQFPYGISASFALQAREGYVYPPFNEIYRNGYGWTNIYSNKIGTIGKFGDQRLPNFFELSLRVEKTFNLSEKLRFTVAGDGFNILNANTALERQANLLSARFGMTQRILNPRVFRFGVRVEF
jgi:Carboxypeptidase regulatory-like domain